MRPLLASLAFAALLSATPANAETVIAQCAGFARPEARHTNWWGPPGIDCEDRFTLEAAVSIEAIVTAEPTFFGSVWLRFCRDGRTGFCEDYSDHTVVIATGQPVSPVVKRDLPAGDWLLWVGHDRLAGNALPDTRRCVLMRCVGSEPTYLSVSPSAGRYDVRVATD